MYRLDQGSEFPSDSDEGAYGKGLPLLQGEPRP